MDFSTKFEHFVVFCLIFPFFYCYFFVLFANLVDFSTDFEHFLFLFDISFFVWLFFRFFRFFERRGVSGSFGEFGGGSGAAFWAQRRNLSLI